MKKYFSLLLVVALLVTGCGKDKKEEKTNSNNESNVTLEEAIKNSKEIKNAKFDASLVFALGSGDKNKIKYEISVDGKIDSKQNIYFLGKDLATEDEEDTDIEYAEEYIDMENKTTYTLTYESENAKKDETWIKNSFDDEDVLNSLKEFDLSKVLEFIKESKKVDSDRTGEDKYEVKIDLLKALKEIAKATGEDAEEIEEIEKQMVIPDLSFNVYVKGKYVSGIETDLGDILTKLLGPVFKQLLTSENNKTNIPNFKVELKGSVYLTDFGSVEDIKVPEEIVKNAKTVEENIYKNINEQ